MRTVLITALMVSVLSTLQVQAQSWVAFTVTRHVNTVLAESTMDAALTDINRKLQLNNHDCPDDTPCSARFQRSGAVGTFGTAADGLDFITTEAELSAVFAVTTHRAKVVTSVDWCAGGFNPSIIGCGICDGFGYILENWVGGNVYVHEYGHNVMGCGHRNDCDWNVMNSNSVGDNNSVNTAECAGFGGEAYQSLCGDVYDGNGGPLTVAGGPYWITCDVTVPAGRVLTIEAGAEIQLDPGLRIASQGTGTIDADGTSTAILIYSNDSALDFPTTAVDGEMKISNGGILILN